MSQFTIMRFGSAGEIAGANIAPPPERPTGIHSLDSTRGVNSAASAATTTNNFIVQSTRRSTRTLNRFQIARLMNSNLRVRRWPQKHVRDVREDFRVGIAWCRAELFPFGI